MLSCALWDFFYLYAKRSTHDQCLPFLCGVQYDLQMKSSLRKIRKERSLTLAQVSRLVSAHVSTLSRIERGLIMPTPRLAIRLCQLYSITLEDVYRALK